MSLIIAALVLISITFAPLGCVTLWKRYVYFGDALVHASLLSTSLTIICKVSILYSGLGVSALFAILIFYFKNSAKSGSIKSGTNEIISLTANAMTSVALIIIHKYPENIDIGQLLLGDILAITNIDLIIIVLISILVFLFLFFSYKEIILISLNDELAMIYGKNIKLIELTFLILLSCSIFFAVRIAGILLVTSILLLPAMSAQLLSKTPWQMMIHSGVLSLFINILGMIISFYVDLPISAVIILLGSICYIITKYIYIKSWFIQGR